MSLYDRISGLNGSPLWSNEFLDGYNQCKSEAIEATKETDELIEEFECALSDAVELHGSMHAMKVLGKIREYKERT